MQASTSVQTRQRFAWQAAVLASVAAVGIAVGFGLGTWVADDGSSASSAPVVAGAAERGERILDLKFAQMDAADAAFAGPVAVAGVSEAPAISSILDLKFAQMDAADSRFDTGTSSALVIVAGTDRGDQIIDTKFAQMDAAESRFDAGASSAPVIVAGTDRGDQIIEVKFAQMDAEDAR